MHSRMSLVFILALFLAMNFLLGCSAKHSKIVPSEDEMKAFYNEEEKLSVPYWTGNVDQARQSLNQTIQLIKQSNGLSFSAQAGFLYIEYARLYVLEKRAGNKADAELALSKAKFWRIRNLNPSEALDDSAIVKIMSDTPELMVKYIDVLDAGDSGNRPKYLQYITNSL